MWSWTPSRFQLPRQDSPGINSHFVVGRNSRSIQHPRPSTYGTDLKCICAAPLGSAAHAAVIVTILAIVGRGVEGIETRGGRAETAELVIAVAAIDPTMLKLGSMFIHEDSKLPAGTCNVHIRRGSLTLSPPPIRLVKVSRTRHPMPAFLFSIFFIFFFMICLWRSLRLTFMASS